MSNWVYCPKCKDTKLRPFCRRVCIVCDTSLQVCKDCADNFRGCTDACAAAYQDELANIFKKPINPLSNVSRSINRKKLKS